MTARILVVEDEFLVAHEIKAILEDNSYHCAGIAPDLASARAFFDGDLDLALVDLNLRDGLTGPEIGRRLTTAGVPVIFITANPGQLGSGIAGAVGVLTKPTDEEAVIGAVRYALESRAGNAVAPPRRLRLFG